MNKTIEADIITDGCHILVYDNQSNPYKLLSVDFQGHACEDCGEYIREKLSELDFDEWSDFDILYIQQDEEMNTTMKDQIIMATYLNVAVDAE